MSRAKTFLRSIAASGAGGTSASGLESTGSSPLPPRGELVDRFREEVDYIARLTAIAPDTEAVEELARLGDEGLRRLDTEGLDAELSDDHLGGLEAVIETDGSRPVLFVKDGLPDLEAPSLRGSQFAEALKERLDGIGKVCRAVARVDDPSVTIGYQGTCFVVGDDLVMTNRHVLECISKGGDVGAGIRDGVTISFGWEAGMPSTPDQVFRLAGMPVFCGAEGRPDYIFGGINFDRLDIAILKVEREGRALPAPLGLRLGEQVMLGTRGRMVHLVGYPGNNKPLTPTVFERVFASVKSFKRLAPGVILEPAGAGLVDRDPHDWIMTHDASTLGGNSGSALADLDGDGAGLLGIHFGGAMERRNWAIAFERLGGTFDALGVNRVG